MEQNTEYHNYRISNGNYKNIVESIQRYGLQVDVKCIDNHMCFIINDVHLIFDWGEWLVIKVKKYDISKIKLRLDFEFCIMKDEEMHKGEDNV